MATIIRTAINSDDVDVTPAAVGLLARYLSLRVDDIGPERITLEDISGLDEDRDTIAELINEGVLLVALPVDDTGFPCVYLAGDAGAVDTDDADAVIEWMYAPDMRPLASAPAPASAPAGPTRHNHDDGRALPFGRTLPEGECPRCDELRSGAPARRPDWVDRLGARARADAERDAARRAHFAPGGPHALGTCGPVCTFGDW